MEGTILIWSMTGVTAGMERSKGTGRQQVLQAIQVLCVKGNNNWQTRKHSNHKIKNITNPEIYSVRIKYMKKKIAIFPVIKIIDSDWS